MTVIKNIMGFIMFLAVLIIILCFVNLGSAETEESKIVLGLTIAACFILGLFLLYLIRYKPAFKFRNSIDPRHLINVWLISAVLFCMGISVFVYDKNDVGIAIGSLCSAIFVIFTALISYRTVTINRLNFRKKTNDHSRMSFIA